jgi:large repetitive protein
VSRRWREMLTVVLALLWTCVAVPLTTASVAPVAAARAGAPFRCDSTYYLMRNDTARERVDLGRVIFPTPGSTGARVDWFSSSALRYNAIGYNHVDNYIYGIASGSAEVVRLDAAGNAENLGAPVEDGDEISGDRIFAGAFRADGAFVFEIDDTAYAVNVATDPPTVVQDRHVSTGRRYEEWAVNPIDNQLYTVDDDHIVRIDMTTPNADDEAVVSDAGGDVARNALDNLGAIWMDGNGRITVLGGPEVATDFYQASFNPRTGTYGPLTKIGAESSLSTAGDGANCAFRMGFEKTVNPTTVTAGGNVTYTYEVTNGSGRQQVVTFTDDLTRPGAGGVFRPGTVTTPTGTVSLQNDNRKLVISNLTVQSGQSVRITAGVTAPATAGGVLRDQAQLSGATLPGGEMVSDFPGTPDPADSTPLTVQRRNVDLTVSKSVGNGQTENLVRPNDTFAYTITATNNGADPSWPATITDVVPSPLTPIAASDGGTVNGRTVTWTVDNLAPHASLTRTITVRVDADGARTVVNTAHVAAQGGGQDANPANDTSGEVTTNIEIPIAEADLRITKSAPANADPGGPLTYTIAVTNAGPDRAGNATVTDTLPDGFTVTSIGNDGSQNGRTVTWNLASLAPNASVTLTVAGTTPPTGGSLVNRAVVTPAADGPTDPDDTNNAAETATTVRSPSADLALAKEGPASVPAGQQATYQLRVRNNGPDTAPGAVVRDTVPDGFTLVAVPQGATLEGAVLTWTVGTLANGDEQTLTYAMTAPAEGGSGTNTATVTPAPGGPPDPGGANDTASVTTAAAAQADLEITKAGPAFVDAGDDFDWTIDVVNHGPSTARNVVVTDTVPAGFAVGTPTGPGTVTVAGNENGTTTVRWAAPNLAPGATARFTVPVTAPNSAGAGTNSATATSDTPDPTGAASASNTVAVRGFTVAKTVRSGAAGVRVGDEVVYEIVANNASTVPYDEADGLATFTDDMSDVLDDATLVSVTPQDGVTNSDNGFTWSGALAAGTSRTIVVTVRVTGGGGGDLRNTVRGGTNCGTGSTAPACAPSASAVRELTLSKTASQTVVSPGDVLDYRVVITNTGGYAFTAADPAIVTDDLSDVLDDATFGRATATTGTVEPPTAAAPGLRWSGPLTPGATVTLDYTVTINDPQTGDGRVVNTVSSVDDADCLPDHGCGPAEPTLVRAFTVNKAVDRAEDEPVAPGEDVTYTVVATNTGRVAYDEATFDEDLTGVLDDADLVDVAADAGTVAVGDGGTVLTWTGPLPVADGPGATLTVKVKVRDPDTDGDHSLANVVIGSVNCPDGGAAARPECTAGAPLPVRGLTVAKKADVTAVHAGGSVAYTITVTNSGAVAYTEDKPAVLVDDLAAALDDGAYAENATVAGGGTVAFADGKLTWTGPLAVAATATITYQVTAAARGAGDHRMRNVVLAKDSNCVPAAPPDQVCGSEVAVAELAITKTADVPRVRPGGRVTYTVTVHNIGAADYGTDPIGPATWTDDLSQVLDDARYLGDAQATTGGVAYTAPALTWSGKLAAGKTATIRYSVQANDPAKGDKTLLNTVTGPDSACPCAARTPVDPAAPDLASTGASVVGFVVVGLGLLAAGAAFFLLPARRRRRNREDGRSR